MAKTLIGRDGLVAQVADHLRAHLAGHGTGLVVSGAAGVGKSSLVQSARARAALGRVRIVEIVGIEAELDYPFAALEHALTPLRETVETLPAPQYEEVGVAVGWRAGAAPDALRVAMASLAVFDEAALDIPLLLAVDDVQWIDHDSLTVFAFAARRLQRGPITIVFAGRSEPALPSVLDGIERLEVPPLDEESADTLLRRALRTPVDPALRALVLAQARGNPLALLSVAEGIEGLDAHDALAQVSMGEPLELALGSLGRGRRLAGVSPLARRLALLAAEEPSGSAEVIFRAARDWTGAHRDALESAVDDLRLASVVEFVGGRLVVTNLLTRAAIHAAATAAELRVAHGHLAQAGEALGADAGRTVWHRARAAYIPDERLAATLEDAAKRAADVGGLVARSAFLSRSAELTSDPSTARRRRLEGADAALRGGMPRRALELVGAAAASSVGVVDGRDSFLRGQIGLAMGDPSAVRELLAAASGFAAGGKARETTAALLDAWKAASVLPKMGPDTTLVSLASATLSLVADADPRGAADDADVLLLRGHSLLALEGRPAATATLRCALQRQRIDPRDPLTGSRAILAMVAAYETWDDDALDRLSAVESGSTRHDVPVQSREVLAYVRALWAVQRGDFVAAAGDYAEFQELGGLEWIEQDYFGSADVQLTAWRGDETGTRRRAGIQLAPTPDAPASAIVQNARWALLVLAVSRGRYAEAAARGEVLLEESPPSTLATAVPEIVEAAARADRLDLANRAAEWLVEQSAAARSNWARGLTSRCRALVADDDEAEALYEQSLDQLAGVRARTAALRTELAYGEWLRRRRRRSEAAVHLGLALSGFQRMGAAAFAERAESELAATGHGVVRGEGPAALALTGQEARVACLAATGATNRAIAAQLYLSKSTVEYHLRKVFVKLDISSREELSAEIGGARAEDWGRASIR